MKKLLAFVLITAISLAGCSSANASQAGSAAESGPTTAAKVELTISAAASLTDCMNELGKLYHTQHPEITLTFNFGSSGALQQQIEQGAPVDVFVSAGKKQMAALQENALMDDATVRDILQNRVVLIAPADAEWKPESFDALDSEKITQIGVAEPESVPVGQYTQEILESLDLQQKLLPKLVFAKDVREVLAWVESENVQAGVVYETDAKTSEKVVVCAAAPEDSHKPVVYPAGVVKSSKNSAEAKAFAEFLASAEAKAVFEKFGFSPLI